MRRLFRRPHRLLHAARAVSRLREAEAPARRRPAFHATAITHRKDAVYPATIVGIPPMEDFYIGGASVKLFLPIFKMNFPEIVDLALPAEGVFPNLVFVGEHTRVLLVGSGDSPKSSALRSVRRVAGHGGRVARATQHGLWGMGQMMFTKYLIVVDDDVNVHNTSEVLFRLCANTDPQRDSIFTKGPADVLDHATSEIASGSKLGIEIGGTKLQLAVGDAEGIVVERRRCEVDRTLGAAGIRQQIEAALPPLLRQWRPLGVAVGFGGPVERALRTRRFGPYTFQAAIAAVHSEAPDAAATDWPQIAALYGLLARIEPSPVVELNRGCPLPQQPPTPKGSRMGGTRRHFRPRCGWDSRLQGLPSALELWTLRFPWLSVAGSRSAMKTQELSNLCRAVFILAACLASVLPARAEPPSAAVELARQLNQAFIEVAEQVSASVVVIRVARRPDFSELDDEENPLWEMLPPQFRKHLEEQRDKQRKESEEPPGPRDPVFDGRGSGVVIREEGYILTNFHVVDGAEKIKVRFKDRSEYDAEVRGVDAQSDIAVLKIDPKGKSLKVANWGDSDKTRVGEFAIAIGAPFDLDYSVTFGHVSAKGRSHIINSASMDQDFLQTDANINPGNSGGPLVNLYGEVIGINTLIHGLRSGIGFAIPVNLAREVAERLISEGKFVRAYLGVRIRDLRDDSDFRDLVPDVQDGVVVTEIPPGGPAAKSDLKPSDIITAVDGRAVTTAQELRAALRSKPLGEPVPLHVYRAGRTIPVKITPQAWPDTTVAVAKRAEPLKNDEPKNFGLTVEPVTTPLAEQYGVEKTDGVIVTAVEPGSPAESKKLQPGDIITELNRKPVKTVKQFRELLKAADRKKGVIALFTSRGARKFEVLKEAGD